MRIFTLTNESWHAYEDCMPPHTMNRIEWSNVTHVGLTAPTIDPNSEAFFTNESSEMNHLIRWSSVVLISN